eukprot:TRINITY_DN7889_c1_g1_i1.p2 TRINITY_DN7889_c1_g1~~TRINITY_DN7889_c1_g1_i1.p2  ORF type:complete len:304 (+),score=84.64 TRINITY_DN7889_c1_g1_i1:97-912(+)
MGCCFSGGTAERDRGRDAKGGAGGEARPQGHESLRTARSSLDSGDKHAGDAAAAAAAAAAPPKRESMRDAFLSCCAEEEDREAQIIRNSASWEALAALLDVDVEDPVIIVLCAEIARTSPSVEVHTMAVPMAPFLAYCQAHQLLNVAALRRRAEQQRHILDDPKSQPFRQAYTFLFAFIKPTAVWNVATDDCIMYWQLLLPSWSYLDPWTEFVKSRPGKEVVTRDEWLSLLDLVGDGDEAFDTYSADASSWPLLIDDFIEHHLAQQKQKQP